MKKLTGRAAEDFKGWLFSTRNEIIKVGVMEYDLYYMFMYMLPETCQDVLIIEWFDSVGVCIEFQYWSNKKFASSIQNGNNRNINCGIYYETRTEAINDGIKKANELYNLNN